MHLAHGQHILVLGTVQPGYQLPTRVVHKLLFSPFEGRSAWGCDRTSLRSNTVQRTWDKLPACQPVAEFRHCLHKILTSCKLIPRSLNGIALRSYQDRQQLRCGGFRRDLLEFGCQRGHD